MNSYARIRQPILYILFQMVTHLVRFFHTGILGQHKVKVNEALTTCLASTHGVKTHQLANVLLKARGYYLLLCLG